MIEPFQIPAKLSSNDPDCKEKGNPPEDAVLAAFLSLPELETHLGALQITGFIRNSLFSGVCFVFNCTVARSDSTKSGQLKQGANIVLKFPKVFPNKDILKQWHNDLAGSLKAVDLWMHDHAECLKRVHTGFECDEICRRDWPVPVMRVYGVVELELPPSLRKFVPAATTLPTFQFIVVEACLPVPPPPVPLPPVHHDPPPYDLFVLVEHGAFSPRMLRCFGYQLFFGMDVFHSAHAVHRDLKADNILLSRGLALKFGDFGAVRASSDAEYMKRVSSVATRTSSSSTHIGDESGFVAVNDSASSVASGAGGVGDGDGASSVASGAGGVSDAPAVTDKLSGVKRVRSREADCGRSTGTPATPDERSIRSRHHTTPPPSQSVAASNSTCSNSTGDESATPNPDVIPGAFSLRMHMTQTVEGGTGGYMPPEWHASRRQFKAKIDTQAVDMWSAGVVLYTMAMGCFPFGQVDGAALQHIHLLDQDLDDANPTNSKFWDRPTGIKATPGLTFRQYLIDRFSKHEPPTDTNPQSNGVRCAEDLIDLFNRLVHLNPEIRYTSRQALNHRFWDHLRAEEKVEHLWNSVETWSSEPFGTRPPQGSLLEEVIAHTKPTDACYRTNNCGGQKCSCILRLLRYANKLYMENLAKSGCPFGSPA